MRQRIYLNEEWCFAKEYTEQMLDASYVADQMEQIRIPHTVQETPFHYFDEQMYQMICAYRRILHIPAEWKEQNLLLTFEGAAHIADVYVNGVHQMTHACGYTAFTVDITDAVEYGADNVLVVKLNTREDVNVPPFGYVIDYMTYGGIYREVYLEVRERLHIIDLFVRTKGNQLITDITLSRKEKDISIRQWLNGELLGENHISSNKSRCSYEVTLAECWDIDNPVLYEVKTELYLGNHKIEEQIVRTGFRDIAFRGDGFYLNDRKIKLRGLNRHQSYPYVGYAMPTSMQRYDAEILKKELGVNAVRTSHYPQSHDFISRCDELGILVFTELPGWQHIGDEEWKKQAVRNVEEMVTEYRNHPSIILWGVRINESADDDEFYRRTNEAAHRLDDSRPTGGVRAHKKSTLLEDVYTYNDFLYDGTNAGCDAKKKVTSDKGKGYLISEYNGHMYPDKNYDCEEHQVEHSLRHAAVLDAVAGAEDIAGSFGWCMFDYNTHKDFGSGDRICYHGVMDMFRNPKLAASVYASQSEQGNVMEVSSSMDIGEHPGCNRGDTYVFTNADCVRMYKNDTFIKEFKGKDSPFRNLTHGPILIDDFIGNQLVESEKMKDKYAKEISLALNNAARNGLSHLPLKIKWIAVKMVLLHHMKPQDAVTLYNKYIGDWGGKVTTYRFEAIRDGKVVDSVQKEPMEQMQLVTTVSHTSLIEGHTYDVAEVRIRATDQNDNLLRFAQEPITLTASGPIEIIGPNMIALQGGMSGTYIKTVGQEGKAVLKIACDRTPPVELVFTVTKAPENHK